MSSLLQLVAPIVPHYLSMKTIRLGLRALPSAVLLVACGGRVDNSIPQQHMNPVRADADAPASTGDAGSPPLESTSAVADTGSGAAPPPATAEEVPGTTATPSGTTPPVAVPTSPPVVTGVVPTGSCPNQCGNNVIDSCEVCSPTGSPGIPLGGSFAEASPGAFPTFNIVLPPIEMCRIQAEQCDGPLTEGQTCESIGFVGGDLQCDTCVYNDAQCESCGTDPHITQCQDDLGVASQPTSVALATNGDLVALTWTSNCITSVSWFDNTLREIYAFTTGDVNCTGTPGGKVAIAPLGTTGWVVGSSTNQYVFNAVGELQIQTSTAGSALFAAARSGDNPLLVRTPEYGVVTASLLDDAGADVWTVEVASDVTEAEYGSATATSDGFLVGLRTSIGAQIFRLDALTGVVTHTTSPGGSSTEYPQVSALGDQARAVWADFSGTPSVYWATLDAYGQRIGDPVLLGTSPDYFNRSPIVIDAQDTLVLFGGYTGGTGIGKAHHLRRVDADGATIAGDIAVQSDPNGVSWPQLVPFDGKFVAAWVGGGANGRVGIASLEL